MRTLSLAVCVLGLAAFMFWGAVLDLGFYGWDTYPLIAASRVDGIAGLFATFGEELMEGRFEGGHYWRPLVHLSFALDYALHGLTPWGYHFTDLGLLVAGALATHALARRLIGPGAGAWLAAFVFLMHPVHFDVLPLPPRRADSLAVVFTLAALATHAAPATHLWGRGRTRSIVVGLLALAALLSKETGVLAPALVCLFALLETRPAPPAERLREMLSATWPALTALGLWAVARTLVLGGLGGAVRGDLLGGLTHGGAVLTRYTDLTLLAGPLAGGLLLCAYAVMAHEGPPRAERSLRSLGLFLVLWIALLVLFTGAGGGLRSWYALAFVPPVALVLGGVLDRALRTEMAPLRWGGLILTAILVGAQWKARSAPARWEAARTSARATDEIVQRFTTAVRAAVPGTRIDLAPSTQRRTVLPPYALEAYAELALPGPTVRVEVPRANLAPAAAGEVLVVLVGP